MIPPYPARLCALLAALLFLPHCLIAQLSWTSANAGLEGGVILTLHPTPAGAMLASTWRGLHRFDPTSSRWSPVLGGGGYRWQVAADRTGTLFAATEVLDRSTAYVSTDDGRTWDRRFDSGAVVSLVGDGSEVVLYGSRGRSTDGGATWIAADTVYFDFIASGGGGRMAAMIYGERILTSTDGGRTWSRGGVVPAYPTAALTAIGDRVLAIAGDALHVTTDGGVSWSRPLALPAHSIAHTGDGGLIVSSQDNDIRRSTDGIHRSDDSGRTWRQIASGYFQALAATTDGSIVAECTPGISRSTDGGATWQQINSGLEERMVETWAEPDGTLYALADRSDLRPATGPRVRDLYRSRDDAASWQLVLDSVHLARTFFGGRGIATTHYEARPDDPSRNRDYAVVSVDHGTTWTTLSPGSVLAVASSGESIAAVSMLDFQNRSRANLHVTTDGGATWIARTTSTRHDNMAITESGMIVVETQEGSRTLAGSNDLGATWRTLLETNRVLGVMSPGGESIVAVTYDASDSTSIIERSGDGGASFTSTKTRDAFKAVIRQVNGMTLIPMQPGSGSNVWRSSDSGATWTSSPSIYLWGGAFGPKIAPTGEILAIRAEGIIRSTDYGARWHRIDTTRSLVLPTSNGRVLVASNPNGGVYRTSLPSGVERAEPSPTTSSLAVRPIPATTRLIVETSGAGIVTLLDLNGREVRRLAVDGTPGSAALDVAGLAQGVYVARMTSAAHTSTARVVIVAE